MSKNLSALSAMFSAPRRRHRPELRRALRALRALLDQPEQTQHALEVGYALDGDWFQRELLKTLRWETGRQLFRDQPSLLAALADRSKLRALPEGSLGRAYLAHLDRYDLTAEKLISLRRETDPRHAERAQAERWWVERLDLTHDLLHVLSGYGADESGEAALLLFTLAQLPTRSGALLSVGATLRMTRSNGPGWLAYVWRAWRRGRRAAPLSALPYEALLAEPLEDVRRAVGIGPAPQAPVANA